MTALPAGACLVPPASSARHSKVLGHTRHSSLESLARKHTDLNSRDTLQVRLHGLVLQLPTRLQDAAHKVAAEQEAKPTALVFLHAATAAEQAAGIPPV